MTLTRVFQQKNLFFGGVIILLVTLVAVFAPMLTSYDPINDADLMMMEMPPSSEHLFGTDSHGRDAFSRVLYGARVSLSVGLITQVINTIITDVFGLLDETEGDSQGTAVNVLMELILDLSQAARGNKDWPTSDKNRDGLAAIKIQVKDGKEGSSWSFQ